MPLHPAVRRIFRDPGLLSRRLARSFVKLWNWRPSSAPYLSGDSFRAASDHVWDETGAFNPLDVAPGDIIYCKSDYLEDFCKSLTPIIQTSTVLLLGNSVRNFRERPGCLSAFAGPVYAQNLVNPIPGFLPLPVGLENRHRQDVGRPRDFKRMTKRIQNRIPRIMWTFNLSTNRPVRKLAQSELRGLHIADELGQVSPARHREALARYAFVASPPGVGLDTHRTWEALYLGCVPIVLESALARGLQELGLPIWIVPSFSVLKSLGEAELSEEYQKREPLFASSLLWFEGWASEIRKNAEALKKTAQSEC